MAPTVYVADLSGNPGRSHLYPDALDGLLLESGLRVRRRPHRPPRGNKGYRTRGSVWLQSPLMGLTVEDSRQQAMSREEEEANISTNSISSSIDSNSSSNEDSNNPLYRSGSSGDESVDSDKEAKSWSREEILLHHQQQQCQRLLLLKRREGLLDITMRTVNLMRRNQQLQHRLAALQAETRAFVRSVLSNPENQAIRVLTSRTRRWSNSEDADDNDKSIKRLKQENSITTISTTSPTVIFSSPASPTNTITTTPATMIEQDPVVSESDSSEK